MLVCNRCGEVIHEDELEYSREDYGEMTPDPCHCGGEFVEATECACCGEWFDNEDLNGVCEVCLEEHTNLETAIAMGAENLVEDVAINGFFAYALTSEQINEILGNWVKVNIAKDNPEIAKYLNEDKGYFADFIVGG